jgi:hypothetical protein
MNKSILTIASVSVLLSGCAVFMAAKQPDNKDLSLMQVGMTRNILISEFGEPIKVNDKNGSKTEIFKFVDGYSTGGKVGRAVGHAAADVFTLGLWEVVGTPVEGEFDGDTMAYQVTYDKNDVATEVIPLKK